MPQDWCKSMLQETTWTIVPDIFHHLLNVPPQYCERITAISPAVSFRKEQRDIEFQQDKMTTLCTRIKLGSLSLVDYHFVGICTNNWWDMQDDQGSLCLKVPAGSAACARCQWQALPMHENRDHLWRYASFGMPYPKIKKPYSHLTEKKLVHIGKPQNREIVSLEFTDYGLYS